MLNKIKMKKIINDILNVFSPFLLRVSAQNQKLKPEIVPAIVSDINNMVIIIKSSILHFYNF